MHDPEHADVLNAVPFREWRLFEAAESYRMPARYMAQLIDYLESTGLDRAIVLRTARIRSLADPKAQLTLRQVEALLRAAEQVNGRVDLGFELGRRLNPASHDILGSLC